MKLKCVYNVSVVMNRFCASVLMVLLSLQMLFAGGGRFNHISPGEVHHVNDTSVLEGFAIRYRVNSTEIDQSYLDNSSQIQRIKHYMVNSPRIDSITIYSWASPEGPYRKNAWLSRERGKSARRFLLGMSPDSAKFNSGKIKLVPVAENWPGLISLVEERYDGADKEKVLEIMRNPDISDDRRKHELQKLDRGRTWRYLIDNYMPELRSATWICIWAETIEALPVVPEMSDRLVPPDAGLAPLPYIDRRPAMPERWRTVAALKTNLLYDAVTALNFAVEVPFNEHFSILYEHHCPWWLSNNNKYCLEFLSFGGEFRWWFAPRPRPASEDRKQRDALMGHFLGVYGWGGKSDIQWGRDFGCYQFDFMSAGLTYGYAMPVGKYLNLEFSLSAGYARIPYQHYIPTEDWQILIRDDSKAGTLHYFGPTKAEISLVIPIRAKIKGGADR